MVKKNEKKEDEEKKADEDPLCIRDFTDTQDTPRGRRTSSTAMLRMGEEDQITNAIKDIQEKKEDENENDSNAV